MSAPLSKELRKEHSVSYKVSIWIAREDRVLVLHGKLAGCNWQRMDLQLQQ